MQKLLPNTPLTPFLSPQNPNYSPKFHFPIPLKLLRSRICSPLATSNESSISPVLSNYTNSHENDVQIGDVSEQVDFFTKSLLVRPLVTEDEFNGDEEDEEEEVDEDEDGVSLPSTVDVELSKLAKKMPGFELESGDCSADVERPPPTVDVDVVLSKAKILMKSREFRQAELILQECIRDWPEAGRAYVLLGKILLKLSRDDEARDVYEKGCLATQGKNAYLWQRWAVLESKKGNLRRARELFRVATVADKKDSFGWHCWAVAELKEGNDKIARNLLNKALKLCGGNEYIYHTLARIEAKAKRYDQSRDLFQLATNCNPNSTATWDGWAKMEAEQGNNHIARQLFEKAIHSKPTDAFSWHSWGVFEASLGNVDQARKLLKIGHALNPSDPVLLQSLALLEYKYSTPIIAREIFKKASVLYPSHQPLWLEWGRMEWEVGSIDKARELYQRALSINSTNETAAHVLHGWGVLEQKVGNLSAARRLFRASLNVKCLIKTWNAWASLEEGQGNLILAKEIRNLGFQKHPEAVIDDDASSSWVTGDIKYEEDKDSSPGTGFDLDAFILTKLKIDPSKPDKDGFFAVPRKDMSSRRVYRPRDKAYSVKTASPIVQVLGETDAETQREDSEKMRVS